MSHVVCVFEQSPDKIGFIGWIEPARLRPTT
jgi:hypothetical protein